MIEITFTFLFFLIVLYGNGLIFSFYFNKGVYIKENIIFHCILGLIITGFLAQILSFFFPLNTILLFLNFIIVFIFIYKKILFRDKLILKVSLKNILFLFVFFLSIVKIYGSGFSDDLNHYHGSFIGNTDNKKIIIGMNFLHNHFGFNSLWLILNSYFNFDQIYLQQIHIFNSLIFFLVCTFLINEIINYKEKKRIDIYILWCSVAIIFLFLKFTRLKEFGIDRGAVLVFIFLISYTIKYFSNENKFIFISSLICLFLTLVKIFYIFSFIIPTLAVINSKNLNFFHSRYFLIISFLFFLSLFKSLLISGCIIYPFEFTCIKSLPWYDAISVNNLILKIEASAKNFNEYTGILHMEEYIKNFNWFQTWFNRNAEELLNITLTSILIVLLTKLFIKNNKNKKLQIKRGKIETIILILFLANLLFFLKSPVIRYHQTLFILLAFNISLLIIRPKIFNFNLFLIFFVISLIFNFSKNINRIKNENFINDPYKHIKEINWYHKPQEKYLGDFKYYIGWIDSHPSTHRPLKGLKHKKIFFTDILYK